MTIHIFSQLHAQNADWLHLDIFPPWNGGSKTKGSTKNEKAPRHLA